MSVWRSVNYQCGSCAKVVRRGVEDRQPSWYRVAGHEGTPEGVLGEGHRPHDEVFCSPRCVAWAVMRWWAGAGDIERFEAVFKRDIEAEAGEWAKMRGRP